MSRELPDDWATRKRIAAAKLRLNATPRYP